jgi:hypothetical protein
MPDKKKDSSEKKAAKAPKIIGCDDCDEMMA